MFKQRYYKDDHIFYNSTQLAQVRCAFTVLACQYGECTPTPRGGYPALPNFGVPFCAYTLFRKTTKFDVVTRGGEGRGSHLHP